MADAESQIGAWIAQLRRIGRAVEDAAPEVAEELETSLRATASAGTSPEGDAWAPRKKGGRAMSGAASHVHVEAVGTTIVAAVVGPEARHNNGTAKGHITRRILPLGAIPPVFADAIRRVLDRAFQKATK